MPDNKRRIVNNPSDYEKARATRILQLSQQWGVPTTAVFSQVKRGPKSYDNPQGPEEYTSYWTFDKQGRISQSTRDYANPRGTVAYTPQDIRLQQQNPGMGLTQAYVDAQAANQEDVEPITARIPMKKGGKVAKKYKIDPKFTMTYGGAIQAIQQGVAVLDQIWGAERKNQANYGANMAYCGPGILDGIWAAERTPQAASGIKIKPENRGKFTKWAKRHGMSVSEAANHVMANKDNYSSSVVKMANFAKNARGWDKGQYGYEIDPVYGATRVPVSSALENTPQGPQFSTRNTSPEYYQRQQAVSNFFQNDPYRNYIPANASMQGPSFYENEYMMESGNPDNVVQTDWTPMQNQGQQPTQEPSNGWSADLSLGPAIVGLAGLVNQAYNRKNRVDSFMQMKRRNLTAPALAQSPYGRGSQGIYNFGGAVRRFTPDQINFLAKQGYNVKRYQ